MLDAAFPSGVAEVSMEQCPFPAADCTDPTNGEGDSPVVEAPPANFVANSTFSTKMQVPVPILGTLLIRDIWVVAETSAVVW